MFPKFFKLPNLSPFSFLLSPFSFPITPIGPTLPKFPTLPNLSYSPIKKPEKNIESSQVYNFEI